MIQLWLFAFDIHFSLSTAVLSLSSVGVVILSPYAMGLAVCVGLIAFSFICRLIRRRRLNKEGKPIDEF